MLIFKIFRRAEWDAFRNAGETLGAPVDLADGFIHFSTAEQVVETVAKHFAQRKRPGPRRGRSQPASARR